LYNYFKKHRVLAVKGRVKSLFFLESRARQAGRSCIKKVFEGHPGASDLKPLVGFGGDLTVIWMKSSL